MWALFVEPALAIYLGVKAWQTRFRFFELRFDRWNILTSFLGKITRRILAIFYLAILWLVISLLLCIIVVFPGSLVFDECFQNAALLLTLMHIGLLGILSILSAWVTHQFLFSTSSEVRDSPFLLLLYVALLLFLTSIFELIFTSLPRLPPAIVVLMFTAIGITAAALYQFIKWMNMASFLRKKSA